MPTASVGGCLGLGSPQNSQGYRWCTGMFWRNDPRGKTGRRRESFRKSRKDELSRQLQLREWCSVQSLGYTCIRRLFLRNQRGTKEGALAIGCHSPPAKGGPTALTPSVCRLYLQPRNAPLSHQTRLRRSKGACRRGQPGSVGSYLHKQVKSLWNWPHQQQLEWEGGPEDLKWCTRGQWRGGSSVK